MRLVRPGLCTLALLACAALPTSAAAANAGGASAPSGEGGTQYGAPLKPEVVRPVVTELQAPSLLRAGRTPSIRLRIDEQGERYVRARVVVLATPGDAVAARISLGRIRTGVTVRVPWPKKVKLAPGSYVVRVHARDRLNHVLARKAHAAGRAVITVEAPPTPVSAPATVAPAVGAAAPLVSGIFPVRGPFTYGDSFGAPRNGYTHQGVDIAAAEGTPVVAPTAGTISSVDYQASGAGYYVVMQGVDGWSFFFAHCQKDSTVVAVGQVVAAGAPICAVGTTGRTTGPHLHFEIWLQGWRASSASHPIDPLPALQSWTQ